MKHLYLSIGLFLFSLCTELWQVYLAAGLQVLTYCKFSLVRALMSRCIETEETGKIFSVLGIFSQVAVMVANPIYRNLYDFTLPIFPGAEIVMTGGLFVLCTLIYVYVYTQRHGMLDRIEENSERSVNSESITKDLGQISSLWIGSKPNISIYNVFYQILILAFKKK